MFCASCGKELSETLQFCTSCGAAVGKSAPAYTETEATAEPNVQLIYEPQQQPAYQQPYEPTAHVDDMRKKSTKALAAFFAMLLIVTMTCGWFSIKVPTGSVLGGSGFGVKSIKLSLSSFEFSNILSQSNGVLKAVQRELQRYEGFSFGGQNEEIRQIKQAVSAVGIMSAVIMLVKVFAILAIIALIVFVYLILIENKNGVLVGQIGVSLAFLAAFIFAIDMFILNIMLSSILSKVGAPYEVRTMLKFSSSIWVYATMLVAAVSVVFITVRKKIFKEE